MKYKLLACSLYESLNIGDYIQALAVRQFLPTMDGFIERERLDEYDGEEVGVIMNGWFMHEQIHWPPSPKIRPLFVGFHVNILAENGIYSPEGITYLKKHEPIGCRDKYTMENLLKHGINAYFSGCITLSLGMKYAWKGKREGIYFVDTKIGYPSLRIFPILFMRSLCHIKSILKIYKNTKHDCSSIHHWANTTFFYFTYSKLFEQECLTEATYIHHESEEYHKEYKKNIGYLSFAETLIKRYAKAEMVVTSRIHCALPCLGLDTPVLFVDDKASPDYHRCRFDGLIELFNVVEYSEGMLDASKLSYDNKRKISQNNMPKNKDLWRPIANNIITLCKTWMTSDIEN